MGFLTICSWYAFYRCISENTTAYINRRKHEARDEYFDYIKLPDEVVNFLPSRSGKTFNKDSFGRKNRGKLKYMTRRMHGEYHNNTKGEKRSNEQGFRAFTKYE